MATITLLRPWLTLAVIGAFLFGALVTSDRPTPRARAQQTSATWEAPASGDVNASANGVTLKTYGDCAVTSAANQAGRPAIRLNSVGFGCIEVSDAYIFSGDHKNVRIDIDYYDDGAGKWVSFQYDSPGTTVAEIYKQGPYFSRSGPVGWKTKTYYLTDAYFGNRQNASADLRFLEQDQAGTLYLNKVTITRDQTAPTYENATNVSFTAPNTDSGLALKTSGDCSVNPVADKDGRAAIRLGTQSQNQGFACFAVDKTYIDSGNHPNVRIDIDYYDDGSGKWLSFQYDAEGNSFKQAPYVYRGGPAGWKTKTIYLTDAYFGKRENDGADLRFHEQDVAGTLHISKVTITRDQTAPTYTSSTSVSFTAPGTENGLTLVVLGDADSAATAATVGGRSAIQISANGYAYFDVHNTFIYQGKTSNGTGETITDVQVEVSYYDRGYGFFYLQWDSTATAIPANFPSQSFNNGLRTDNVVYLTNTNTWLTYTFNIPNVYFGGRYLLGTLADLRITYPIDVNAQSANQGNLLAFDKVTITRSTTPLDRAGTLNGLHPGYGDPVVVWTRLAQVNDRGHGLYQVEGNGAAAATATTIPVADGDAATSTTQVRQASGGSISFDVNDNYILNGNAYDVYVGVEYYDEAFGTFWLEYDAGSSNRAKQTSTVTGGTTGALKRTYFYLTDAYFGNGQEGGADFRIKTSGTTLKVKTVYVARTPGGQVQPRATVNTSAIPSFSKTQRVVAAHYFPVFDGYYPKLWPGPEGRTYPLIGPAGADSTTHILTSYSWRSVAALKQEMEDAKAAGIDMLIVWYSGSTFDAAYGGVTMLRNLVAAARQVSNPPKLGILLDPFMLYAESVLKTGSTKVDLTDANAKGLYLKYAVDFFSIVPTDLWAAIDGRPVIFAYYQGPENITKYDKTLFSSLSGGFERAFGVRPYVIPDFLYDPTGTYGIYEPNGAVPSTAVDEFFSWAAGYCDNCPTEAPGYAQNNVMEIGPGFNDGTLVRNREDGAFYTRSWQRAIAKGMHLVGIDTFNYWVEGAPIGNSDLYGKQYLDLTKTYAALYKQTTYGGATTAGTTLGTTNSTSGVYLDRPRGDSGTAVVTKDGKEGRSPVGYSMFFSIHDSFLFNVPNGTSIQVAVEYWDEAPTATEDSFFDLKYDGQSDRFTAKRQGIQHSKTWKTATFSITDAAFRNRQDEKNDFALIAQSPGSLIVRSIQVTRPASMVTKIATSRAGMRVDIGVDNSGAAIVPAAQTLQVTYVDGSAGTWTAAVDKAWLTLSANSGTAPQTISLFVDPSKMGAAADVATVTFTASNGLETKVTVYARIGQAPHKIYIPYALVKYTGGW
ncbi:MAG: DUF5010 domain-containing protein [Chloroflexi bacterium]|nr:DUF5010 domain-containing protein [Chloroflexota bacterium]